MPHELTADALGDQREADDNDDEADDGNKPLPAGVMNR
jgi:hypothetical protein